MDLEPDIYALLKDIAKGQLRRERRGHTLQPTALVHEAWLRLLPGNADGRVAVLAQAAVAMRRILVDHARRRKAQRRGGNAGHVTLHDSLLAGSADTIDVLELDEALRTLAELDPRQARIVELRFFAGLTAEEAATVLDVSRRTVQAEWQMARAFLRQRIGRGSSS